MNNNIGCKVSLDKIPGNSLPADIALFSETHSRYLLVVDKKNIDKISKLLKDAKTHFSLIGTFKGDQILIEKNSKAIINLSVDKAKNTWLKSLGELVLHG